MSNGQNLTGRYFVCCQFCVHDGSCELKHHEFMGAPPGDGVDKSPYPGHEGFSWHFSMFGRDTTRSQCAGRILATDNLFYPLACECATVINGSNCAKLVPNEKGEERLALAKEIATRRKISLEDLQPEDLPEPDPSYTPAMF